MGRKTPVAALVVATLFSCAKGLESPSPQVRSLTPAAICNDRLASTVTITGRGLSPLTDNALNDPRLNAPMITLRPAWAMSSSSPAAPSIRIPDDPAKPSASDVTWSSQEKMTFTVCPPGTCSLETPPRTDLAAIPATGLYSVEVQNPTGLTTSLPESLLVVPPPELDSMSGDLLCTDIASVLTLKGLNFHELDGEPGAVLIGGGRFVPRLTDCRVLTGPAGKTVKSCRTAEITVPAGSLMPGALPVQFEGPDSIACRSKDVQTLTVVPSPTLATVTPDLICDGPEQSLTLKGTGFLSVDGVLPKVHLDARVFSATSLSDCTRVAGPDATVESCTTLTLQVTPELIGTGFASVTVTNPSPVDGTSNSAATLGVVPIPHLTGVARDLACNAQGTTTFVLTGSDFVKSPSPMVALSDGTHTTTLSTTPVVATCSSIVRPGGTLDVCTQLSVEVPGGALLAGVHSFVVTNTVGCASSESVTSLIVAPPVLTSVAPAPVCTAQGAMELQVQGSGFLSIDGATPTLTLTPTNGPAVTLATAPVTASCSTVGGRQESVRSCTQLTATAPRDSLPGDKAYSAVVHNPLPASCDSTGPVTLDAKSPPVVDTVAPAFLCRSGGQVTLTGTGFRSGATVKVGTLPSTSVLVSEDGTNATAQFGGGLTANASYPVSLVAGDGCSSTAPAQLPVADAPTAFFADPPVIWNGATNKLRLYGSHVTPPLANASLQPAGGGPSVALTTEADPQHPSRVYVTIPAGTDPGTYDLLVSDASPCPARLTSGLKVVATSTLAGLSVAPATGFASTETTIAIRSSGAFQATPRVSLASPGGAATALSSVIFVNSSVLVAVVPAGFSTGPYDLIVVNPDGSMGALPAAFTVLAGPPPTITKLNPGAITFQTSQSFQVIGTNFQSGASVTLTCIDQSGAAFAGPTVAGTSCGAGTESTCIAATVTVNTAGSCLVSVTNPDGGQFHFSSLVVQNPAARLGTFRAVSSMTQGRRGLGLVTAQATPTLRFVYALGGDDGNATGAVGTVEAASLDLFGNLGPWFPLREMRSHRTLLGAIGVGRFVYAIGGSDGATGAIGSVERAAVLDPARAPTISDIDLTEGTGQGLTGGQYVYRVSAVMAASDAFNPSSEGLASNPFVAQVPSLSSRTLLTLTWNALPGVLACPSTPPTAHAACGYRIYRSPSAGSAWGSEVLIAENVAATSLVDSGLAPIQVSSASVFPVPLGTLGPWTTVSSLATERSGPAIATLTDVNNPAVTIVYAMGGNDRYESVPNYLSSTEYMKITTAADGSQTFGAWQAGPALDSARWQAGGYGMNVGGTNYLWVGPGRSNRGVTDAIEGSTVAASGLPGAINALNDPMDDRAGYATVGANGVLFALGGAGGQADRTVRQSRVATPPEMNGWSNASASLVDKRLNSAAVLQGGFVFVCGGRTDTTQATRSCETSVW